MTSPFQTLDASALPEDAAGLKREIDELFGELEAEFIRLLDSPRRLKELREFPMSSVTMTHELATVYSLRALELAGGAALMIEQNNQAAAFPVLRSLYEVALATAFAENRFRKLVLKKRTGRASIASLDSCLQDGVAVALALFP